MEVLQWESLLKSGMEQKQTMWFMEESILNIKNQISKIPGLTSRTGKNTYQNPLKKDYIRLSPFVDFVISGDNIQVIADEIVRFLESPQKFRDKRERGYDWARLQTWKKLTTQYQKLWTKEELR